MYSSDKSIERIDSEIRERIRKIISPVEAAPKLKHIRAVLSYTWEFKTANPLWAIMPTLGVWSDALLAFKTLYLIHKLLLSGPAAILIEAARNLCFLDSIAWEEYASYLKAKIQFHERHFEFKGDFEYEDDYAALKLVANQTSGMAVLAELNLLLEKLIVLGEGLLLKNKELRLMAVINLVEESKGLLKFITGMLSALHLCQVEDYSRLKEMVGYYQQNYINLKRFYSAAQNNDYIKNSGLTIPTLGESIRFEVPVKQEKPRMMIKEEKLIEYGTKRPSEHGKLAEIEEIKKERDEWREKFESLQLLYSKLTIRKESNDLRELIDELERYDLDKVGESVDELFRVAIPLQRYNPARIFQSGSNLLERYKNGLEIQSSLMEFASLVRSTSPRDERLEVFLEAAADLNYHLHSTKSSRSGQSKLPNHNSHRPTSQPN